MKVGRQGDKETGRSSNFSPSPKLLVSLSFGTANENLVLGLGNILLEDEGVGVRVIERLQVDYIYPDDVLVLDGGTLGLDLLAYIEDHSRIVIVDVVEAGKEPGTLIRLVNQEILPFCAPRIHRAKSACKICLRLQNYVGIFPKRSFCGACEPKALSRVPN